MADFTLRQLRSFVAAADAGTTRAAAAELFLSQSAVSSAIADLEGALGVQLLVRRRGKGVGLTETGRSLLPRARRLLTEAEGLRDAADELQQALSGRVTIGCFDVLAPSIIPRLIEGFTAAHPAVEVDFLEGSQPELIAAMEAGRIELAIMFDAARSPAVAGDVLAEPVPHVLLSAQHPLADADAVHLRELADDPFIWLDAEPSGDFYARSFSVAGISPRVRYRSRSLSHVRALVQRGLGFALITQGVRTERHSADRVVEVPVADAIAPDPIVIGHLADALLTRRAEAFREFALRGAR